MSDQTPSPVMALAYRSAHSSTLRPMVRTVGVLAILFGSLEILCATSDLLPANLRGRSYSVREMNMEFWLVFVGIGSVLNLWEIIAGILNALPRPRLRRLMLYWAWCEIVLQAALMYLEWSQQWQSIQRSVWAGTRIQLFLPEIVEGVRSFAMWIAFPLVVILFYSRHEFKEAFEDFDRAG